MLKTKLYNLTLALAAIIALAGCGGKQASSASGSPLSAGAGEVLPLWAEGYMDIHFINTGRGECALYIFPDGTTMLVDAAGSLLKYHEKMPSDPKPSAGVPSSDVIEHYLRHYMPEASKGRLDYYMLSHYHSDHMGSYADTLPMHPSGEFRLAGFADIGSRFPCDKLIFRGDPEVYISGDHSSQPAMDNLFAYVKWAEKENGTKFEYMEPGRDDEIVLKKNAEAYPGFKVQNIAASGFVWTGSGVESRTQIPSKEELAGAGKEAYPAENIMSCVFTVDYGKFNYYCGGDLQYNGRSEYPYKDMESQVAGVLSEVDVMKADHHGTGTTNAESLVKVLNPSAVVINVWRDVQPNRATVERIFTIRPDCMVYTTNMADLNREILGEYIQKLVATNGHVVIRVAPGGDTYYIYVLDDTNEEYRIAKVSGPCSSR